jgi:sugar/nucleoside kinase (ribokinase family)
MQNLDFIAIGDTAVNVFIRLKEASVHCDINHENCTITMPFAEKIPYEFVEVMYAVGNSANASIGAARLGLNSALVTNIGGDLDGDECLRALNSSGVNTEFIARHPDQKTNFHYVLWYENDRTILVKHEEYKHSLPELGTPKWLYLSSLGSNSAAYHEDIIKYVSTHPEVSLAFQPGTFQMKLGYDSLKEIYMRSNIFFSNVEEAEKILGVDTLGMSELLRRMHAAGPKIVVITDGAKGAHAYDGKTQYYVPVYEGDKVAHERTGAGDAFASTTVAALALGENLSVALAWGAINSASVVQHVGPHHGLLSREKIKDLYKHAPESFQVTEV